MPKNEKVATLNAPIIGFDLGGTKMLATVLSPKLEVLAELKQSTHGTKGQQQGMQRIINQIKAVMELAKITEISCIGIGCPGMVNPQTGVLRLAPNLGWRDMPIRKQLSDTFKCPVAVANDVDAGTFGEVTLGCAKGMRSVLGVFPGTGVGAGFFYEGKLLHGTRTSAMEIGHMIFPGTSLNTTIPGTVKFEELSGRLGIASGSTAAAFRGLAPRIKEKAGFDLSEVKSKLLSAARTEDPAIATLFENSTHYLGMGIANVVNLLAPDCVVLGGGLVESMPDYYQKRIEKKIKEFAMPDIIDGLKIKIASLGEKAVALGAAAYATSQIHER